MHQRRFAIAFGIVIGLAVATTAAVLFGQAAQQQPAATAAIRWEYAIVRLDGPEPRNRDASLAVLQSYGEQGWEAVELLPPAYDILMKRPATNPAGR
jgi:hypothetical protein